MMTLLGSALGFASSFLPEVLNVFKQKQEHAQQLERMKLEMDLMARRSELQLTMLDKKAEIAEVEGLYAHDASIDAGGFVNALRGSVRPVITYAFFGLFALTEAVIMLKVLRAGDDWTQAVELMWTPEVSGLFAACLSFWFGGRSISKYMRSDK
tara:strand:+ start:134 stop:595 length:462 start_codon:yes stop_codon:yes gene_type:complete